MHFIWTLLQIFDVGRYRSYCKEIFLIKSLWLKKKPCAMFFPVESMQGLLVVLLTLHSLSLVDKALHYICGTLSTSCFFLYLSFQIGQKGFFILEVWYIVQALRDSRYKNIKKSWSIRINCLTPAIHFWAGTYFLVDSNSRA